MLYPFEFFLILFHRYIRIYFFYLRKMMLLLILFLMMGFLTACSLRRVHLPLSAFPSTDNRYDYIKWFRFNFYKIYLLQKQKKDGRDRLRYFIRFYPQKAIWTYSYNLRIIEKRRQMGLKLGEIELLYLTMNFMIKKAIPLKIKKQQKYEKQR